MIHIIIKLSRRSKQILILFLDTAVIIFSSFFAFILNSNEWNILLFQDPYFLRFIFLSPILAIPIFYRYGLYLDVIRYLSFKALWRVFQAITIYSILWGLFEYLVLTGKVSLSIHIINWQLLILFIGGSRLFARWILESNSFTTRENVLIFGAGSAGRQLSTALASSNEFKPVGFIDDSSELIKHSINGLQVYSRSNLSVLIETKNIKEVFLAMPAISRTHRNAIINFLEPYPVLVKTLPSISKLAQGKIKVNDLLDIDLRDLLGREPVKAKVSLLKTNIYDKVVLVTGAGGSIGSELCRQIVNQKPKKLILYDMSEHALYLIEQEIIRLKLKNIEVIPVLGSVADKVRLSHICKSSCVQTIYHSAAYKHVPLVEYNQSQGVLNNIIGTKLAAEAAILANVETFVLISTDKAVRPTNIMGATKRVSEMILQALNTRQNKTCFTMVRFGNVLDSSGSVIPLFKKQIRAGGPVTVTHSNVVRYFMTIPEAVELVIQAGAMAKGGEVFVLDMGAPVLIYDLAIKMIKLSGLEIRDKDNPDGDIEIKYTGLRPGEKLFEELLVGVDSTITENDYIRSAKEKMIEWDELNPILEKIERAALNNDSKSIYKLLTQLVPQFNPNLHGHEILNEKYKI